MVRLFHVVARLGHLVIGQFGHGTGSVEDTKDLIHPNLPTAIDLNISQAPLEERSGSEVFELSVFQRRTVDDGNFRRLAFHIRQARSGSTVPPFTIIQIW